MRLKLTLRPDSPRCIIPINYQYQLSSAIYSILANADPEYTRWLHEQGYCTPQGKPIKLFVFSKLFIPDVKRQNSALLLRNFPLCNFYIESPIFQDFVQNFVIGLFSSQNLIIESSYGKEKFQILQVETLPEPSFSSRTKFKCLSPIVVSTIREEENGRRVHYYRPLESGLSDAVKNNLLSKYRAIYHHDPEDTTLKFEADKSYIRRRGGERGVSKLIHIKEGSRDVTYVKAFELPFTLSGSLELIKIAYQCGVGQKNSMGFGMVEVVH